MSEEKITSDDLIEFSKQFNDVMNEIEKNSEEYWNSLSKEHQLAAFCAVSRRIYQAEIVDQGTYRHALYGVFGFGPESYAPAQLAGYMGQRFLLKCRICTPRRYRVRLPRVTRTGLERFGRMTKS